MTIYTTGTVSVSNGSAVVTGSGTAWAVGLVTGGMLSSAGVSIPIASVTDDTHLTLAYAWPGTTATGAAYAIDRANSDAASVVDLYDKLTRILVTLSLVGITPDASGSLTDRAAITLGVGDKGFLFLHAEIGVAFAFYRWTGTAWDGPFAVANASGGAVSSLVGGTGIAVDATNPAIPSIAVTRPGTAKTTPVDADEVSLFDSAASFVLKRLTWANLKATLKSNLALREVLTANRTYFVRTDGNDANTGLANTSGGAFLTLQKAINVTAALDISTFNVTIQVAAGTYTAGVVMPGPWTGVGTVTIVGDTTTPSNVVISTTSADCINVPSTAYGARLSISGLKLQTTTSGHCVNVATNAKVVLAGKCEFGTSAGAHNLVSDGGQITSINVNHNISGGAAYHMAAVADFGLISIRGGTITLTGTPAFGSAFAGTKSGGQILCDFNTYSGSATGKRYDASNGGIIITGGGGISYLPGSTAGTGTNMGTAPYGMYS
ncbi:hypothetical protein [Mesorhizobium sp. CO1-1-9]|uniref:hypothetical protein n=1 Tax=Mesorhizobium sp. CO1-1-9 TaxID=2876630 RepID=UPI001CCF29A1|nr:hypothetical protein [Mesorhizobium sp. CO1-1-9]MBZ9698825.1 hypothetical protein [Mesorhizobium sp. CO1-1-9]